MTELSPIIVVFFNQYDFVYSAFCLLYIVWIPCIFLTTMTTSIEYYFHAYEIHGLLHKTNGFRIAATKFVCSKQIKMDRMTQTWGTFKTHMVTFCHSSQNPYGKKNRVVKTHTIENAG